MARPQKHSVDYFTHDNNMRNDKKLKAVKAKYGTIGYAVYVMMLESLCEADMLFIDIEDDVEFEMLSGDLGMESEKLKEILEYLAKVKLLTIEKGILYCKQLDCRVKPVFDKRKENLDSLRVGNPHFRVGNPHSKVKESKEETNVVGKTDLTPAGLARKFFEAWKNPKLRGEQFKKYSEKLNGELDAFCNYWTERTRSGKKERWETEKTWELPRRIGTWNKNNIRINGKLDWGKTFKPAKGGETPDGRKIICEVQGGYWKLEDGTFLAYRGTRWVNVDGKGHAL